MDEDIKIVDDDTNMESDLLAAIENILEKKLSDLVPKDDNYDKLLEINQQLREQNELLRQRVEALELKMNSQITVADQLYRRSCSRGFNTTRTYCGFSTITARYA